MSNRGDLLFLKAMWFSLGVSVAALVALVLFVKAGNFVDLAGIFVVGLGFSGLVVGQLGVTVAFLALDKGSQLLSRAGPAPASVTATSTGTAATPTPFTPIPVESGRDEETAGRRRDELRPPADDRNVAHPPRNEQAEPTVDPSPVQVPDDRPPATRAPIFGSNRKVEEPSPSPSLRTDPDCLIDVWDAYRTGGDGRFTVGGLRVQIQRSGIAGEVVEGTEVGADDSVAGVILCEGSSDVYLLPNFLLPHPAMTSWFTYQGSGSRMARVKKLIETAVLTRTGEGFELTQKGAVA